MNTWINVQIVYGQHCEAYSGTANKGDYDVVE